MRNTSYQLPAGFHGKPERGVALIAVLAILTVLAVLASVFILFMKVESRAGALSIAKVQADLLAQSAFEHALSQLRQDSVENLAWDYEGEPWSLYFKPDNSSDDAVYLDRIIGSTDGALTGNEARWIYVKHEGEVIGRYAVSIEDEAGKINANVAAALGTSNQNEGVGTFEIMLTDGGTRGLPITLDFARRIVSFRYGRDLKPGQMVVDDNYTASLFGSDDIDNNADGEIDEEREGTDEQREYNSLRPQWDDRSFSSVNEIITTCSGSRTVSRNALKTMQRYTTLHSRSRDMYYDEEESRLKKQININVGNRDQIRKIVRRANAESKFEPSVKNLNGLVANLIDYRDENHVLTTVGNEYGVEAVNFNEIMANDGSYSMEADTYYYLKMFDKYSTVHRMGLWYNDPAASSSGFCVESVHTKGGGSCLVLGKQTSFGQGATIQLADEPRSVDNRPRWNDFKQYIRSTYGGYPNNLWKNATLLVYNTATLLKGRYPIISNTRDTIHVGIDNNDSYMKYETLVTAVSNRWCAKIDTLWRGDLSAWCVFPSAADLWSFPTQTDPEIPVPADLYYYAYVGEQNFDAIIPVPGGWPFGSVGSRPWQGFYPYMDLDGDQNASRETRMDEITQEDLKGSEMKLPGDQERVFMKRTAYQSGAPVRARNGYINMLVSTSKNAGYVGGKGARSSVNAFKNKNCFDVVYIMRPDIVELYNISDRNISVQNWRVVINTGSYADQVALIDSATHFSQARDGLYDDPNPVIPANGYFYLTNKRDIFDLEYGQSKQGVWGDNINEAYPCFELPDYLWGVRYKITKVDDNRLYIQGAEWKDDQMKFEMQEIHSTRPQPRRNGVFGIRKSVYKSGSNWLEAQPYIGWSTDGVEAGDDVLLVGMPREGGFLSMTLKNEYGQIVARTIEYGSAEPEELNYSTEKYDPTHYTWIKNRNPTFGGTEERARNTSSKLKAQTKSYVKNNPYVSVGEIRKVRKASDWENVAMSRKNTQGVRYLKALVKYFTTYGIRLDAEEEGAHVSGWQPAFGTASYSSQGKVNVDGTNWEPDIWAGMKLRVTRGTQRGEEYAIIRNTENSLMIDGYSVAGNKALRIQKGDLFSIGPGYSTAFYYTRRGNDAGVWEWKKKGLEKQSYGLYVFGLNDSINTTEFLEENYNAGMEMLIYNYEENTFDPLPLKSERQSAIDINDPYTYVSNADRLQYDKSDGIYCGLITAAHISLTGGIKIKIIPHNLNHRNSSGFAWFDYVYLTPETVEGKINVNTAPPRVLSALNGVQPELASNIALGRDQKGLARLKPYKNISDVLDVNGMSPELFGRICNLITARSDQFRINILAEVINDVNSNGTFDSTSGDTVLAQSRLDVIVDRSGLNDNGPDSGCFKIVLKQ